MSTTIDSKVVEMQFDNKHFEKNVQTSLGTLDKLKQSLNLTGASKGLENVTAAAKNCNLSPLSSAAESVKLKFSALEVMAVTALGNITNSAVNAGKRIVSSLTIAPVGDGFKEYEMMLNAIQTTMAGTGKTASEVEAELKKLDEYADKTVYSTADMLTNLPKFTNAGVELEVAREAMIGIANATALAGGDASKASIAFYNLGQAIGTGYLTRMDYNSINNAGIATMEWKNQMVEAAIAMGTLTKVGDDAYKAGNKTLTLQQLFIDGLQEQWATTDVMVKVFGDYGNETTEIGKKAYSAAQDIKTFTQMMESLKATAGTGWKDTWQLIVGDLDDAKSMWTSVTNAISGVLTGISDARNEILKGALNSNWEKLTEKINEAGISTEKFEERLETVLKDGGEDVDALKEKYGSLKNAFQNGAVSSNYLKKALDRMNDSLVDLSKIQRTLKKGSTGDDVKKAQRALKELGYNLGEFGEELDGIDGIIGDVTESAIKAFQAANNLEVTGIIDEETLEALEKASENTEKLTDDVYDLIDAIEKKGGRDLFIESFATLTEKLGKVLTQVKEVWDKVFANFPKAEDVIYGIIEAFHGFVENIEITDEKLASISTTVEGFLRIIELAAVLSGGVFGVLVKMLKVVSDELDVDFWNIAETVAEVIIAFRNWLVEGNLLYDFLLNLGGAIIEFVSETIGAIKEWVDGFKSLEIVKLILQNIETPFKSAGKQLKKWCTELIDIFCDFITVVKTLDSITFEKFWNAVKQFFSDLFNHFLDFEAVLSPILNLFELLGLAFIDYIGLTEQFNKATKWIKDALQAYRDWREGLEGSEDLPARIGEALANGLWSALTFVTQFIGRLGGLLLNGIKNILHNIAPNVFEGGKEVSDGIVSGLADGLWDGLRFVGEVMWEFGKAMIAKIKDVLGIHSPSTEFAEVGEYAVDGLVLGLQNGFSSLGEIVGKIGEFLKEKFGEIDFGSIFAIGISSGAIYLIKKIGDMLGVIVKILSPLEGVGDVLKNAAGVLGGVTKVLGGVTETLNAYAKSMKAKAWAAAFKDFAIAIAILVGAIFILTRLEPGEVWAAIGAIAALAAMLVIVSKVMGTTGASGIDIAKFSGLVLAFGVAMLLMTSAIKRLAKMDEAELQRGGICITAFTTFLLLVAKATSLISDRDMKSFGNLLLKVALAFAMMAIVCKIIGTMEDEELRKAVGALTAFTLIIWALMGITQTVTNKDLTSFSKVVMSVGGAFILLAIMCKLVGGMDTTEMLKAGIGIAAFVGVVYALMKITHLTTDRELNDLAKLLSSVGIAFVLFAITARLIAGMSWEGMAKAAVGLVAFGGVIAGLVWATKLAGRGQLKRVAVTLLAMSISIGILAAIAMMLSLMSLKGLAKGIIAVTFLGAIVAGMVIATKNAKKDCYRTLLGIGIAIVLMTACVAALSLIDGKKLAGATTALVAIVGVFSLLIYSVRFLNTGKKAFSRTLITIGVLTAVVGALTACIAVLAQNDPSHVLGSAAALSLLLLSLAASMRLLNGFTKLKPGKMLITVGAMVLVMGALAGVLAIMRGMNPAQSIGSAIALSALLYALMGAVMILNKVKAVSPMALIAVAGMTLVVAGLAGILYVLRGLDPAQAIGVVAALSVLLIALSAAVLVVSLAKGISIIALGAIAVMTLVVAALAGILYLLRDLNPEQSIGIATALSTLILALSAACVLLGVVGLLGPAAFIGIGVLGTLIVGLGTLIVGIGALMEKFPQLEGFLNKGIPVLEKIGYALGSFFGNILSGFAAGITGGLPKMASDLSEFMNKLQPFIDGANQIDESTVAGVRALAETILLLTGTNLIDSLTSWFTGGSSLTQFGEEIAEFGPYLKEFANSVSGADLSAVETAANAIKTLASAANEIPKEGGLAALFSGENSLANFGPQLAIFGFHLKMFADNVAGMDTESVTNAANAAKALAEMANTVPNEGGIAAWFAGENSIATFGSKIAEFGLYLKAFSTNVTGIDTESVTNAANAAKALAEMANTIPNEGGVAAWFAGENALGNFGVQIAAFGMNLKAFSDNVVGIDSESVGTAVEAGKKLAEMANVIPNEGGVAAWFAGENAMANFGVQIASFGVHLKMFADNVAGINPESITAAASAGKSLAEMVSVIPNEGGMRSWFTGENSLASFGPKIASFGTHLKTFGDNVAGINIEAVKTAVSAAKSIADIATIDAEKLGSAISEMKKLSRMAEGMAGVDYTGMANFGNSLGEVGKDGIDKFIKAFSGASDDVKNAGKTLGENLAAGAESYASKTKVKKAGKTLGKEAAAGAENVYDTFISAGEYLGEGLVAGIEAMEDAAYNAGYALGQAAAQGEKDGQDSNSPSKLTIQAGKWLGEGLVIGIDKMGRAVYNAGYNMGDSAVSSLSSAIARVTDVVNSDIDSQPTIRPVLDLSDIQSGVGTINGMFGMQPSLGVLSNVGTISSMMNRRQNGVTNDDIVSAIKGLGNRLDNRPTTQYNINGITYDDGSNVVNAVQTLVRAAKVERRI